MSTITLRNDEDGPAIWFEDEWDSKAIAQPSRGFPGQIFLGRAVILSPEEARDFAEALNELVDYVTKEPSSK